MNVSRTLLECVISLGTVTCFAETTEPQTAFLVERKVITNKTGVIGIPAGTRVAIVSRHGDALTVKTPDQQFEVRADEITEDAETARRLSQREITQQEILQKAAAEREARYKESAALRQKAEVAAPRPSDKSDNAIDRQIKEIHKQRELLNIELEGIKFEQKDLPPPNSSYPIHSRHYPGPRMVIQTSPNSFTLANRRKEIERKLVQLDQQERLLKLQSR
jgi:DNA repair exonuclease SbcCD ATPase subunit